jgi:Holliday junction resolvase RusA-like endonuclease
MVKNGNAPKFSVQMEAGGGIRLCLPVPPIGNHRLKGIMRRTKNGKIYSGVMRSREATTYQRSIKWFLRAERIRPYSKDVAMVVHWFRSRRAGDVPDRWKDLCDALEADNGFGIYENDSQISDFMVYRDDSDPKNSRIEVLIYEY